MDLRNVGILPQHYTASHPRRPRFEIIINFLMYPNLFIDFEKAYDSVKGKVLHNILLKFGKP
jgi:hypothetical protein